ncbi:putative hydrolase YxeP [Dickeya dianthicola]|uniref:Amidohydrolase n=1 Tax=Dickeya dianthicola TaxID=204039 RepID=A0AAP2D3G1_9GAMM|nr:M20 peptidase aminoacylase family protein [Dickeya dianthicola]ATO35152.1 N-acetyl-L,L-diaminopimelate deacetylase-like protein [Dickeya dianthicola RNS04.9]AYC20955.1 putative hydrolase YxeP [Dickeya dianthicola]MBI0438955.1 amidohydrolase [Dickeya dianthicola]MBI0449434.1 amidohydrolase [Dickeya dianthicola]MBI0453752.1 amidohydrolase [Dickeya dianthicola]
MKVHAQHAPLAQFIQAFRHDLHQHPELSNQEFETTRKIRAVLEKEGIRILDLPLKTGLVAEVGGLQDGPLVVVRSDIDALPIEEESGVAFSSKNAGVMHACGHDFHSSAALGAAILLKRIEPELKGTVRILFQAAEETGLGAPEVIAVGALDGATAIFGIHNDPTLPVGVIGGKDGALTAGVDRFEIKIAAKGCHAAKPHEGNDPIIILGQLISAVQTIISRTVASDNNAVVSITQVHSGSTWNVIPDTAYVEGTVRTFSQAVRDLIEQRFRQIVAGIASTFGAEIEFIWHAGPPSVVNTPRWVDFALQVADDEGFEARRVEASPIGEDFAFYQQKLPGTFMMVGSGGPYALHHPKFRVDDSALFPTAHYLYQLAKQSLEQPSQVA